MAATILIVCPECDKQIKAPANALGKKVRCKSCQAIFVAEETSGKKPPGKSAKPSSGKTAKTPAGKPKAKKPAKQVDDDDEDANPYVMIDMSFVPRCPFCANEMEEDAIICLTCGYNTRTREKARMRKVYDLTFGKHLLWLLPGIGCVLGIAIVIAFNAWYLYHFRGDADPNESWYIEMWYSGGIKLWVVLPSLGIIWLAGKFALKRLILHPKPPEVEKLK